MLDGMSDSIQRSRIENLDSREVDRQSPTGLIFLDIRLRKCCDLENRVRIRQGHWKCHHSIERIRLLPIDVL